MNITSKAQLINALNCSSANVSDLCDEATRRYGDLTDENFHEHRDFLRMNWSGAAGVICDNKWVPVAGGLPRHFLHMSQDGERVCFAKSHEKAQADRFTTVTADRYKELFGMADEDTPHPDLVQTKFVDPEKDDMKSRINSLVSALAMASTLARDDSRSDAELNGLVAEGIIDAIAVLHILAKKGA